MFRDSVIKASLTVNGEPLRRDTDFVVSGNSPFDLSFTATEVLYVGYGISDSTRDDYKSVNAQGKIVLVSQATAAAKPKRGRSRVPEYYTLQEAAQKNGATALLIIDDKFPRTPSAAKGPMYVKPQTDEKIPNTLFISDSIARLIMGADFTAAGKTTKTGAPPAKTYRTNIQLELEKTTERMESTNVVGMLPGTDKRNEAIVITAHYDHVGMRDSLIYYGADDDGSGTVAILEIAEAFSKAAADSAGPRRTVIFMAVSGEEKGLWGSQYYSENPAFPLENTSVNLNIDMIGRIEDKRRSADTANYIYVIGDNRLSSDLRPISEKINNGRTRLKLDYKYNAPDDPERIYYRSDHYNFARKGVPAIFYFSGLHSDYHQPTDTPEKIRYDLLEKRAELIFYTAWEMANRDDMLKRDLTLE